MFEPFRTHLSTNLIFRTQRHQPLRPVLLIGVAGGLVSLGLGLLLLQSRFHALLYWFWWFTLGLTLIIPILVAGLSALATLQDIQHGQFQLLYLTPLSTEALIWGYILQSLYRMRWWLSVLMTSWPLFGVSSFYTILLLYIDVATVSDYARPAPPASFNITLPTLIFLAFTLGLWGANVLGALIGVYAALRWPSELTAEVAAISLSTLTMGLLGMGIVLAVFIPQAVQLLLIFCAPAQFIIFFALAWEFFMKKAQYYARPTE